MVNLLRDPAWQGIGVIITIVLGFISFYYAGKNKIWLYLSAAIVVFIVGLSLGTRLPETSIQGLNTVTVDATEGWQETGVDVNRGDILTIRVIGGGWTMGRRKINPKTSKEVKENYLVHDPDYSGFPKNRILGGELWHYMFDETSGEGNNYFECKDCPIRESLPGSLVAEIVNSANSNLIEPFAVKKSKVYTAGIDGSLLLRINDTDVGLPDNAGALWVEIKVAKIKT
jgi:hypothetical protein